MAGIVVGVDGSEGSAAALRWAAAEAATRQLTLRAVLACGFLDQHHAIVAERFDPEYTADDARAALDSYIDSVLTGHQGPIERIAVADLPARALLEAAEDADLLVVGARGLGGFKGLLLGSVSQRCLHHAPCPVAVVRVGHSEAPADVPPRVAVGIDGSTAARRALLWAAGEATARGATLEVVHAWQPPLVGGFPFSSTTVDFSLFEDSARELVDATIAEVDLAGVPWVDRTIVCAGPAEALLAAAERSHVLVVGARGIGGVQRLLLGSISHQVTLHADRPVVVVPSPAEP